MLIPTSVGKTFENPEPGEYIGVIADVVELGEIVTQWGKKVKIRIIWLINAKDKEGKFFRVMSEVNAKMADKPKKSRLYEIAEQVFNDVPKVDFDSEHLIGRSNRLFLIHEKSKDGTKTYANVKGILPLRSSDTAFAVPADFVRAKDKNKQAPAANAAAPAASAPAQSAAPAADVKF